MSKSGMIPDSLVRVLSKLPRMAIAFSGGVDSRFLAHSARLCGSRILLLHASGPHIPKKETAYAKAWAVENGMELREVPLNPLAIPELRENRPNRCYICKKNLFMAFQKALPDSSFVLCDGSHADDSRSYRPGRMALQELAILSPLAMANLSKSEIRKIAAQTRMSDPNQAARPCLFTRIGYDQTVTATLLGRIENCEESLKQELSGLDFRLRITPKPVLQVNGSICNRPVLESILQKYGFNDASFMECERVSGFFDKRK